MYYCPALIKLREASRPVKVNGIKVRSLQRGLFTNEEIEDLRKFETYRKSMHQEPLIANFLPDDIRPKGIPKL